MNPLYTLPSQDLLLFPLLHSKGPHSSNIAEGLICYTCCPGNLYEDREIGKRLQTGRGVRRVKKNGPEMLGRNKGNK